MARPVKKVLIVLGALASIVVVWAGHAYWVHVRNHGTVEEVTFQTGVVTLRGWFVTRSALQSEEYGHPRGHLFLRSHATPIRVRGRSHMIPASLL